LSGYKAGVFVLTLTGFREAREDRRSVDINEILRNDPKYVAAFLKLILHEAETARLKQLVGEGA